MPAYLLRTGLLAAACLLLAAWQGCRTIAPPPNYNAALDAIPDTILTWDVKDDPDSNGLSRVIKYVGYTIDSAMNNAFMAVGKYGFVDHNDRIRIPIKLDYADHFHEGVAKVVLNDKYGFMDTTGKIVIDFGFDTAYPFTDGWAKVSNNEQHGYIDHSGNVVIPLQYEWLYDYNEYQLSKVEFQHKFGFIDRQNNMVIPIIYSEVDTFKNGLARAAVGERWGMIDTLGNQLIPMTYQRIEWLSDGLICAKKDHKYGYIDAQNSTRIPFVYDIAFDFYNGRAEVIQNNRRFYIDKTGREINP